MYLQCSFIWIISLHSLDPLCTASGDCPRCSTTVLLHAYDAVATACIHCYYYCLSYTFCWLDGCI